MDVDAWRLAVTHQYHLESLTTLAQNEILSALEPYRDLPISQLSQFLSRDVLKIVAPFETLGRQLSSYYFKDQHALAAANSATPVKPLTAIVVNAIQEDLSRRITTANSSRTSTVPMPSATPTIAAPPVTAPPATVPISQTVRPTPAPAPVVRETVAAGADPIASVAPAKVEFHPTPVTPAVAVETAIVPDPPVRELSTLTDKIQDLKTGIKAETMTFDDVVKELMASTQAQLYNSDRENMDYYASLEKHVKTVKRIPNAGGCAWCKRSALFADGSKPAHKFCKCGSGYIYEGESDDKFLDPEQKKFMNDYETAKEQLRNGDVQGRLLKVGTDENKLAISRNLRDSAFSKVDDFLKAKEDELGRPLLKKEEKEVFKDMKAKADAIAETINKGDALSLEQKRHLDSFGVTAEDARQTNYSKTLADENVMAVMRRDFNYH